MQCREFENAMQAVLDERGRPEADPQLAAHASECEACGDLLLGQAALLDAVSRLASSQRCDLEPRRRSPQIGTLTSLAAAAAIVLAVSVAWRARHRDATNLAITNQRVLPGGSQAAVGGGHWLIEGARLPRHLRHYRGAIGDLAVALPEAASRFEDVDHLAPGFRSLRVSLGVIWDTLRRTIPGSHGELPPDAPDRPRTSLTWLDTLHTV